MVGWEKSASRRLFSEKLERKRNNRSTTRPVLFAVCCKKNPPAGGRVSGKQASRREGKRPVVNACCLVGYRSRCYDTNMRTKIYQPPVACCADAITGIS